MKVRTLDSVLTAIDEAMEYSLQNYGANATRKLRDRLFAALDLVANYNGNQVRDLPSEYRHVTAKPYYLFFYQDNEVAEVLVYLLWHQSRRPPTPDEHKALAEEAARHGLLYSPGEGK